MDVVWIVAFLKQKQVATDPNIPGFLKYTGGSMESHAIPCRVKGMRSPVAGEIHMLQQKLHKVSWWGYLWYLGHICSKRRPWVASEIFQICCDVEAKASRGCWTYLSAGQGREHVKNWIHFDTKIKKWPRKHWQSKVCESTLHRRNPIW